MIDAPSRIWGRALCTVKNTPLKSVSLSSSNSFSDSVLTGANFAIPALATRTSIIPKRFAVSPKRRSRSARLRTSPCNASTSLPRSAAASSRVFRLRPKMASLAPLALKRRAPASPIPLLPPVMTATLSCSFIVSLLDGLLQKRAGSALAGDHLVVGEHHFAAGKLGGVNGFKTLYGFRLSVALLRGSVGEDEQMQENCGIVLLLPGEVHLRARLVSLNVGNEFLDRLLDLLDSGSLYAISPGLINRHFFLLSHNQSFLSLFLYGLLIGSRQVGGELAGDGSPAALIALSTFGFLEALMSDHQLALFTVRDEIHRDQRQLSRVFDGGPGEDQPGRRIDHLVGARVFVNAVLAAHDDAERSAHADVENG